MNYTTVVTLKKGEGRTLKSGGVWVFDNEIDSIMGRFKNGSVVAVRDFDGYPMGCGYINQNSKIRIRLLSRNIEENIDEAFFLRKVSAAWNYRKEVMGEDINSCRVIFGEADSLPGITIDKYEDVLVVECLTLGMEAFKETIVNVLKDVLRADGIVIRGVYERSEAPERKKEGLMPQKGFIGESFETRFEIRENGITYLIDVENGQKTGFFLDQKYNRRAIAKLCRGKRVLDCFTHMGTFALNAGSMGAREVLGLDISEFAVSQARENAQRNNLSDIVTFREADVLSYLPELVARGEQYDVVILDPPAFTKAKDATKAAVKGYRQINIQGMKLVRPGGFLATCTCSHFMTQELFAKTIREAAVAAHRTLTQTEFRTQAPDHPMLWTNEASYYLKFYIFRVD